MKWSRFTLASLLFSLLFSVLAAAENQPPSPSHAPDWFQDFEQPSSAQRPQIFMVWNGDITEARITEMLEQFAEQGVGGVFIHPRPGLITEYLSDRWFALWQFTLSECRRLGLQCHIYDENSYPSMFAGGHVIARNPRLAAETLLAEKFTVPDQRPSGNIMAWMQIRNGQPTAVSRQALSSASAEAPVYALVHSPIEPRAQTAHFPYVDLTRPETTETFLEVTLEAYRKKFRVEFGNTIQFVFTDEPELAGRDGWILTPFLLSEFEKEHGYSMEARLVDLCFGEQDAAPVRFDYFSTLHRLWIHNFLKPYHDWCERNGLNYTGHLMEHEWPSPARQTSVMNSLRWMQSPGNDLLGFQFQPSSIRDIAQYYLNLKELSSIGNQLGRERLLCETTGGGGYEMTLRDFKPLEDFAMVMGVNLINPHLSHQTLAGTRKYDWPHTFSDHSPWWSDYRIQADHVGRTLTALKQGQERNRVLVLQPDSTAWLHYRHASTDLNGSSEAALTQLKQQQHELMLALQANQIDFDLGDEWTLRELGSTANGTLQLGQAGYRLLVIPPAMENWIDSTPPIVSNFLAQGGQVHSGTELPSHLNGRLSPVADNLADRFSNHWHRHENASDLASKIRNDLSPHLSRNDGSPLSEDLCWRRHELMDGSILYFFSHPWDRPFRDQIRIEGRSIQSLNTLTGQIHPHSSSLHPLGQTAQLDLPARGHALWRVLPNRVTPQPVQTPPEVADETLKVELIGIERESDNVLVIDYCDWKSGSANRNGVSTVQADLLNWKAHGFEENLWSRSSQYRQNFLNAHVPPDSHFEVAYHFNIITNAWSAIRDSLQIAVERPWLYQARLNGIELDFTAGERWFDEAIRRIEIGSLTHPGKNTLSLSASPFQVLCEIMPVYVTGHFNLAASNTGFTLTTPKTIGHGPWDSQGHPFYSGRVNYRYEFETKTVVSHLSVHLPDWNGSSARIRLGGEDLGVIAWPPDQLEHSQALRPGLHQLHVSVAGNLKNLLGPHFSDGLPGIWSWRSCPDTIPAGDQYRFHPVGLNQPPVLKVVEDH